jgi:hypothetical protein
MVGWHSLCHRLEKVGGREPQSRTYEKLGTVSSVHHGVQGEPALSRTCARQPIKRTACAVFQTRLLVVQTMGGRRRPFHASGQQKVSSASKGAEATPGEILGELVPDSAVRQIPVWLRSCDLQFHPISVSS